MSLRVDPQALRTYSGQLAQGEGVADAAKSYVHQYGDFSFQEGGLIGLMAPGHDHLLEAFDRLLGHLRDLADGSSRALTDVAAHYENTDLSAASAIDATYPPVPRPSPDIH
jgi:hypothetical protein